MKALMMVLLMVGCGSSGAGLAGDGGVASRCLSQTICASRAKDCAAGERCNAALNPPVCQMLYCGGAGSTCGGDSANDLCAGRVCTQGVCGSSTGGGTVSCVQGGASACAEYSGLTADQINAEKQACTGSNTWSDAACSHTDAVGGCKQTSGGIQLVVWYYGPTFTAASVMSACLSGNGTFVNP